MQHVRDTFEPERVYKDAEDARAELTRLLRNFFESSQAHVAGGGRVAPALAAAVTPGLGKTSTTLRLLAEFAPAFLPEGHVAVYVPTLDLADRAYADFVRLAPDVPARVLRGRDASHPLTGARMCERPDIARRIAPVVPSVTSVICKRARGRSAPCAVACSYLEQRPETHSVLFLAHSYLTATPPVGGPLALQIVDEKVWPALIGVREVTLGDWLLPPAAGLHRDLDQHHRQVRYRAAEALQTWECPVEALRCAGLTSALIGALAAHEFETAPSLDLQPEMPRETTRQVLEEFDFGLWALRTGRGQILRYLAQALDTAASARLTLATRNGSEGSRQVLRLHKLRKLDADIPTLLLDADADPEIVEQIRPGTAYARVSVAPKAKVVQAVDRTLSNAWLLDKSRGKDRMDRVLRIVRREVEGASPGRVLLVATKDVLHALHAQATGIAPRSPEDLLEPLLGAHPRWFGPRLQGVNDYEDFDTALLVGRLQPPVEEVERCARCVFGDADPPLSPIERPIFPRRSARRVLKDGSRAVVKISDHPDARASAMLRQMREYASLQAIARLRLVAPRKPKRVVVLGSLLLPGLAVDHATTLDALADGLEAEPDVAGFQRLARALGTGPRPSARGIRLSYAGLAADLPAEFPTLHAAHAFRRRRGTGALRRLVARVAAGRGWPSTQVMLRAPSGGRAIPAIVFADPSDALSHAVASWPDLTPVSSA